MTIYIGVILGPSGAIALLSETNKIANTEVWSYGNHYKVFDRIKLAFKYDNPVVAIEESPFGPTTHGYWNGIFDMIGIKYEYIESLTWQTVLHPRDTLEDSIIDTASILFPSILWTRDDGIIMAEASALLLAYYMKTRSIEKPAAREEISNILEKYNIPMAVIEEIERGEGVVIDQADYKFYEADYETLEIKSSNKTYELFIGGSVHGQEIAKNLMEDEIERWRRNVRDKNTSKGFNDWVNYILRNNDWQDTIFRCTGYKVKGIRVNGFRIMYRRTY